MARKDQLSSNRDRCDICGAALDDDSLVQEFPDGSVVALCAECAADAGPEDEMEDQEDLESDDATVEWAGPHDDNPTAPAPPHFEAEVFAFDDLRPEDPPASQPPSEYEAPENGATKAEAELAAWASSSSEQAPIRQDDSDSGEDYDQEKLEEATLQLVAAIAEADMDEEEQSHPGTSYEQPEAAAKIAEDIVAEAGVAETPPSIPAPPTQDDEAQSAAQPTGEPQTPKDEIIDQTKELLVPVTDLLALQTEMQSALAKLSSTLEHFIADMAISEEKTSAVNNRVQQLEDELESTRERLRTAESLLPESAVGAASALAAATATRDSQLLGDKPAANESPAEAGAAPPSMPPPLTGSRSATPPIPPLPAKAGHSNNSAIPIPPPLGLGVAAGAAAGAAVGAMVPPPLPGLTTAAKAVAGAALSPPSLGGTKTPKTSVSPPLPPAASMPAPKKDIFKSSGAEVETDEDAGVDATSADELLIAPLSPTVPASSTRAAAASPAEHAASDYTRNPVSYPEADSTPTPEADSAPGPVAGAAAAMQKLLRGRKGQTPSESEPEPEPEPQEIPGLTFTIQEVQVAQRYFNDSDFVRKLSEISRSIGKSQANLSRTNPGVPEAAITVFWDIVWYQYLVDLRKELPEGTERVILAQEGMDVEVLEPRFREKNAIVDDHGRLDASELEVRLLSDPAALITSDQVSTPETRLAEDATEEVWDQRSAPEFRWD